MGFFITPKSAASPTSPPRARDFPPEASYIEAFFFTPEDNDMLNTTLPSAQQATALLTPTNSDASVGVLNRLFGIPNGQWHSIYYQTIGGIGHGSLFFSLLSDLDSVVLAWVTLTIVIVMGIGAMNTAHEGKSLGQRYHTIWTPVRSATALVMLAPIPGVGLSLIQGIVLLMVWFSIGGANYLATSATAYLAKNGGQLSGVMVSGGKKLALQIMQSDVTSQMFVNFENSHVTPPSPVWIPAPGGGGWWKISWPTPAGQGLAPGALGTIRIPCYSESGPLCSARKQAIVEMIKSEYTGYAQAAVNSAQAKAGSSSLSVTNAGATKSPLSSNQTIMKAAQMYDSAVQKAEPQEIALANPKYAAALQSLKSGVSNLGWMSLGDYYWKIAGANQQLQNRVDASPKWGGYDSSAIARSLGSEDTATLSRILIQTQKNVATTRGATAVQAHESKLYAIFSSSGPWYSQYSVNTLLVGNPLSNLQKVGDYLVNFEVPAAIGTYTAARAAAAGVAKASDTGLLQDIPVVGNASAGVSKAASAAVKSLAPFVTALVLGLFVVGLLWAYYLPSVPFILWIFGVVSWLLLLVEALVGAVLWAAAIALPEGEGIVGPRGDQGIMLLLTVMFTPALMVIGFFTGVEIMSLLGTTVGESLGIFLGNSLGGVAWNPVTWFASSILASIIAVGLVHKVFGLITGLPEKVFRWVGGQGAQLGGGDERQARSSFAGAAGVVNRPQKLAGASAAAGTGGAAGAAESTGTDPAAGPGGNRVAAGGARTEAGADGGAGQGGGERVNPNPRGGDWG